MKKSLILSLVLLLICCMTAAAQTTDVPLELTTIGNLFKWSYDSSAVNNILSAYDGITLDTGVEGVAKLIKAEGETEEKYFYYYFYFDSVTDQLTEVECAEIYFNDDAPYAMTEAIIEAYALDEVPAYEDEFTKDYAKDYDGSMTVAGEKTICILGGKDATDETYGYIALVFLNRAFM